MVVIYAPTAGIFLNVFHVTNESVIVERCDAHSLSSEKKVSGIRELRDESDRDGMRVVVELRRGEVAKVILNNLYNYYKNMDLVPPKATISTISQGACGASIIGKTHISRRRRGNLSISRGV